MWEKVKFDVKKFKRSYGREPCSRMLHQGGTEAVDEVGNSC